MNGARQRVRLDTSRHSMKSPGVGHLAARLRRLGAGIRLHTKSAAPVAYWWRRRVNFGDALGPLLLARIAGARPVHIDDVSWCYDDRYVVAVGSILTHIKKPGAEVWGAGFLTESDSLHLEPKEVHAVRGPLTRQRLINLGIDCPPVYGDPALLYPRIFPRSERETDVFGIVPHYRDKKNPEVARLSRTDGVDVIDVQRAPRAVIADIQKCRAVASSSLHGLIVALSYGIPAAWVEFSDDVKGQGFKFRDFFASIGVTEQGPIRVSSSLSVRDLDARCQPFPLRMDLDALMESCPIPHGGSAR